ncbi:MULTISPECIES: endonuclease domain-containing protein [Bacteria]|uniref:endonuclease domain-containing protein n=1 Tax=Bacteria TaxID=2 RepID=UPI003C7CEB2F
MELRDWVRRQGGVAHRAQASEHGYPPTQVRSEIARGTVLRLRSTWIGVADAPADLLAVARAGGRLTCLSLARRRGWWIPPTAGEELHLHLPPHGRRPMIEARLHWAAAIVERGPRRLESSIEDALAHIASCFFQEDALTMWESAVRAERLDVESLASVRWPDPRSRRYAQIVRGLSDSGPETMFVVRLSPWGVPLRQQVRLAGHDVDVLIGSHLVAQLDGFAHHTSRSDRLRDVRHDAELVQRGYTVLRFTYEQIVHRWEEVERTVGGSIARGLHLSPAERRRRR